MMATEEVGPSSGRSDQARRRSDQARMRSDQAPGSPETNQDGGPRPNSQDQARRRLNQVEGGGGPSKSVADQAGKEWTSRGEVNQHRGGRTKPIGRQTMPRRGWTKHGGGGTKHGGGRTKLGQGRTKRKKIEPSGARWTKPDEVRPSRRRSEIMPRRGGTKSGGDRNKPVGRRTNPCGGHTKPEGGGGAKQKEVDQAEEGTSGKRSNQASRWGRSGRVEPSGLDGTAGGGRYRPREVGQS
ncbi:hypothetical protein FNV43_RR04636 [Rhamnella rubrinervis]|uniref:Uncharacterized protein n=1 Tax=Rhamnella rubrinervis TaxID=2594499 RepID=A0A8K0MQA0_9ROSA|nr:hypothetical protein FNV43_RR04636 [Rhamnella rubrinervis]